MLERLITDAQERIQEFLEDEEARLLVLQAIPEQRMLAARMLAAIEEQEDGWILCYGVAEQFSSAPAFYAQVAQGLLSHVEENRATLAKQGVHLPSFDNADWHENRDGLPADVWFVSLLEDLTRILAPISDRLLLVLCPDSIEEPSKYREAVLRLCNATGSPRVRYLAIDDRAKPILSGLTLQSDRYRLVACEPHEAALERHFDDFLTNPTQRVLALIGASSADQRILDRLRRSLSRYPAGSIVSIVKDVSSVDAFCQEAAASFSGAEVRPGKSAALVPVVAASDVADEPELRTLLCAEAQFAYAAEAHARQTGKQPLVVFLAPNVLGDAKEWIGSVISLAEEAVIPRVKYVILDPNRLLAETTADATPVPVVYLDLSAERMEQVIRQGLLSKDVALSAKERIRYLSMLASFALSRSEYEEALKFSGGVVELAEESGSPDEKASAWLTIGNVLYKLQDFDLARNAYTKVSSLAIESNLDMLAAQGLESIGHTYFCDGKYSQAAACYITARQYNAKLANGFGEGRVLTWLGEAEREQRQWVQAEQAFQDALALYDDVRSELRDAAKQAKGEVLLRLATLREQTGDSAIGRELRHQAKGLGCSMEVSRTP